MGQKTDLSRFSGYPDRLYQLSFFYMGANKKYFYKYNFDVAEIVEIKVC